MSQYKRIVHGHVCTMALNIPRIRSHLQKFEIKTLFIEELAEICKSKKLKLVTDDGDMKTPGPIILTENHHLLK